MHYHPHIIVFPSGGVCEPEIESVFSLCLNRTATLQIEQSRDQLNSGPASVSGSVCIRLRLHLSDPECLIAVYRLVRSADDLL